MSKPFGLATAITPGKRLRTIHGHTAPIVSPLISFPFIILEIFGDDLSVRAASPSYHDAFIVSYDITSILSAV